MNFDTSTILLVLIAVVPGLFAQRTRNQIIPRSFAPQGSSAELAELVALGIATHGILLSMAALVACFLGWLAHNSADYYFEIVDTYIAHHWWTQHFVEAALGLFGYVLLSFFASHWLGFVYGVLRSKNFFTHLFFTKATWLLRIFGVTGLLGERPIVYELLNPEIVNGTANSVYVEIECKDRRGFYSGQVSQYAIVKDEEPHKPIVLIDVWFKSALESEYKRVEADSIMLDLADAVAIRVKQVSEPSPVNLA